MKMQLDTAVTTLIMPRMIQWRCFTLAIKQSAIMGFKMHLDSTWLSPALNQRDVPYIITSRWFVEKSLVFFCDRSAFSLGSGFSSCRNFCFLFFVFLCQSISLVKTHLKIYLFQDAFLINCIQFLIHLPSVNTALNYFDMLV